MNMSLSDTKTKGKFIGALNMELGIYDRDCRIYAPYYRQAGMAAYTAAPALLDGAIGVAAAGGIRKEKPFLCGACLDSECRIENTICLEGFCSAAVEENV